MASASCEGIYPRKTIRVIMLLDEVVVLLNI